MQAFLSEPTLDGLYRVASVLTLVDAVNWPETSLQHDESVRQVALADQIRITKIDLVSGEPEQAAARLRADLRRINPSAEIALVDWSSASIVALLTASGFDAANPGADPRRWLNVEAYQAASEPHDHDACDHDHDHHDHDHDHDHAHQGPHAHPSHLSDKGVESFVLTREAPLSREELQFLLDGIAQNLGSGLLRVKGLVNVAEEPGRPAVIQGAQHLLHTMTWLDRWPDQDQRSRIVFITQGIPRANLKDVIDLLDRVSARTFKARAARPAGIGSRKGIDAGTMKFDLIVIGSGPGGYVAAIRAAQLGLKTAVVEREHLGGICLNWGCIPTKALLRSAEVYELMRHAKDYGLSADNIRFDAEAVVQRSRNVSSRLSGGIAGLLKKNKVEVIWGEATLTAPGRLRVSEAGPGGRPTSPCCADERTGPGRIYGRSHYRRDRGPPAHTRWPGARWRNDLDLFRGNGSDPRSRNRSSSWVQAPLGSSSRRSTTHWAHG